MEMCIPNTVDKAIQRRCKLIDLIFSANINEWDDWLIWLKAKILCKSVGHQTWVEPKEI